MMNEQEIRGLKQAKLNYIESKNKEISTKLKELDGMRVEVQQVEQEIHMINRILGDV